MASYRFACKKNASQKTVSIIFILLILCTFFLDDSKYKTLIYALLPATIFINHKNIFTTIKQHQTATLLLTTTLIFFSSSTLWSLEPQFIDQVKNSLLILALFISSLETAKHINHKQIISIFFYATSAFTISLLVLFIFKHYPLIPTESRLTLFNLTSLSENNPISSGAILGAIALLAINELQNSKSCWHITLIVLVSGTALSLLLLTKSRGPLISLTAAITMLAILNNDKKTYLYLACITITIVFSLYLSNVLDLFSSRMEEKNYRIWIWTFTLQSMEGNWLFGHGLGSKAAIPLYNDGKHIATVTHSHSSPLNSLRVGGLVGVTLFCSTTIYFILKPLKQNQGWIFLVLFVFGFLCLSTNGKFPLMRPSIEWFSFWIPLFLWYAYHKHGVKEQA